MAGPGCADSMADTVSLLAEFSICPIATLWQIHFKEEETEPEAIHNLYTQANLFFCFSVFCLIIITTGQTLSQIFFNDKHVLMPFSIESVLNAYLSSLDNSLSPDGQNAIQLQYKISFVSHNS